MIGLPFAAGAFQVTRALALPGAAVTPVGAPGLPIGVTGVEGLLLGPVPMLLVAVTVKV